MVISTCSLFEGGHSVEVAHRGRAEHRGEAGRGKRGADRGLPQLRRQGGRGPAALRLRRLLAEQRREGDAAGTSGNQPN